MSQTNQFRCVEFFVLFIVLPVSLAINFNVWIKVGLVASGFIYVLWVLRKSEAIKFTVKKNIDWNAFWRRLGVTFLMVVIATTSYVWFVDKEALFFVPKTNPMLFVFILFVYTFLSVWPQEIIYRTFFFERYEVLFKNKTLFIFINAIVFSLAHLFFRNTLVLILTFIGGIIFGYTYLKFRSTTAVSIEHALYGNWLFTVGMGQMLAFPGMEPMS
ncbi:CPBP family intramembrane metalloprotease [Rasiella rasia]|uniref:CPBP family intramembrane metalloprotease n=1 Tax=Rasiella rasia TaxID=2744027 RepID=A0A6G6GJV3_9FLAO|nr:type II CAAX endopeptidase family protein [Rasiella rasia]QIE58855.1 CPBP family intramembrane metalloprotease [Rasiella rasia]